MFSKKIELMLYVDDVVAEKEFWRNIGFHIFNESKILDFDTFDMQPSIDSDISFSVYDLAFIRQNSPEVADNKPSILFQSNDIEALYKTVKKYASVTGEILETPFKHFTFLSPSGQGFAVKAVSKADT